MTNLLKKISVLAVGLFAAALFSTGTAQAATTNGRIIDDAVFDASGSMSAADIQAFLNQFPNSCLKNYTDDMPSADPTRAYFDYSGTGTVAQIIRRIADNYGVNPRVLLTKLEQEENLVTGNAGCAQWRYASAIGFDCADSNNPRTVVFRGTTITTCVSHDTALGVSRQLSKGTWLLKMGKERANGNLNWMIPDDASWNYSGPMTQGNRKRCGSCATVYYDGYWRGVYVESGATASLYNYTPYTGQAFGSIWEGWWGAGTTIGVPYAWAYVSQSSSLNNIPSGQAAVLTVIVRNTGNEAWSNTGPNPIRLGASRPLDRSSPFYDVNWVAPHRVGTMQEATVVPGQNATFIFAIQAPLVGSTRTLREDFRLVKEGVAWFSDIDLHFDITVVVPQFTGTIMSGSLPTYMIASASSPISLSIRNDGNVTWYKAGRFPVRIGTTSPYNRNSPFDSNSWLSGSRPVGISEAEVAPGQTGTFTFSVKAPPVNETYSENFSPVAEGLSWFTSPSLAYHINVTGGQAVSKIPVYRFYNPSQRVHFFTADETEKQSVQRNLGFVYEGIAFYGTLTNTGTPVYRTYNPVRQTHFFTSSAQERDWVVSVLGYWNEGVAWYGSSAGGSNPIYRLYSPAANTHFYTSSAVERDQAIALFGFHTEGIGFYGF